MGLGFLLIYFGIAQVVLGFYSAFHSLYAQTEEATFRDVRFEAARATVNADKLYQHGRGSDAAFEEARALFKIGAEAAIPDAQFYFARMNQYGHGGLRDFSSVVVALISTRKPRIMVTRRAWNNLRFMLGTGKAET